MVFGNMGDDSGTGVAFTRDPPTGERKMIGEYLLNAQGEDVVAGIRNTKADWHYRVVNCQKLTTSSWILLQTGKAL